MNTPAISVVMGVYNGEEYLEEAVFSILNQTFTDFEFIIVDDASTDDTPNILARLAAKDTRIRILTNTENKGIAFSLNKAIHTAQAPYIARMDADDWSYPERFAKQYSFMEAHPHVSLCGAHMEIYETGKQFTYPCSNDAIRASLFFGCFIVHSTIMLRKDPIMNHTQGYNESMPPVEDYDLWARLMDHHDIVFANLSDVLIRYRLHPNKDRTAYCQTQQNAAKEVRFRLLQQLGIAQPNIEIHTMLSHAQRTNDPQKLRQCGQWMQELLNANKQRKLVNHEVFLNKLHTQWVKLCLHSIPSKISAINIYKLYTPLTDPWLFYFSKSLVQGCINRWVESIKKYVKQWKKGRK